MALNVRFEHMLQESHQFVFLLLWFSIFHGKVSKVVVRTWVTRGGVGFGGGGVMMYDVPATAVSL